jgi:hypothetical protein
MKKYIIGVFLLLSAFFASAQHSDLYKYTPQFNAYQDTLKQLGSNMINSESEPERMNANYAFAKTLVRALKLPHSFNYGFDSLKAITIQNSPDNRFRIFSWHVMFNDGSFRYYGAIQMNNTDGKLQLHGLTDYSPLIKNPADTVTTADKWYGAQYYKIIPVSYNVRVPYYILLGWKGNNVKTNKKVIEVLYFKDGKPYFGMPVFDGDAENAKSKRIIFEYTRQASMLLNYQPKDGMLLFDHIAPSDPKLKGQFEAYGPDFSYDGYKLINGRWKLVQDIPLKNPPTNVDDDYNDPRKPKSSAPRKL